MISLFVRTCDATNFRLLLGTGSQLFLNICTGLQCQKCDKRICVYVHVRLHACIYICEVCVCGGGWWCELVHLFVRAYVWGTYIYLCKLFDLYLRSLLTLVLSVNCLNLQNLLSLNPKIKPFVSVLPSAKTKENKLRWKRNANRKCDVSTNYVLPFLNAS